jgi:hypothetical protein
MNMKAGGDAGFLLPPIPHKPCLRRDSSTMISGSITGLSSLRGATATKQSMLSAQRDGWLRSARNDDST